MVTDPDRLVRAFAGPLGTVEVLEIEPGRHLTFEYILIDQINDTPEQARALAGHARKLRAKVNLIPYNTVDGLAWNRPSDLVIDRFANILRAAKIVATVRHEKGHDIDAACGQLRLKQLKAEATG